MRTVIVTNMQQQTATYDNVSNIRLVDTGVYIVIPEGTVWVHNHEISKIEVHNEV